MDQQSAYELVDRIRHSKPKWPPKLWIEVTDSAIETGYDLNNWGPRNFMSRIFLDDPDIEAKLIRACNLYCILEGFEKYDDDGPKPEAA